MSSDTRGTGRGPDKQNGHDQEAEVAEYQRHLDATSENPDDSEEDSQSGEAAEWADRHPREAGAVGDPGDESADDPATSGRPDRLSAAALGRTQLPKHGHRTRPDSPLAATLTLAVTARENAGTAGTPAELPRRAHPAWTSSAWTLRSEAFRERA